MMLKEHEIVPTFEVVNQDNEVITNESLKGQKSIIFFYPKDNTPTCTIEACNLRDNYAQLRDRGYQIYGVSADSVRKHNNFINKFKLPYDLLADVDLDMIKKFGVWGRKKFMGREFDGIFRTTFVINENGKVEKVIDDVKSKNHAQQILEALEK